MHPLEVVERFGWTFATRGRPRGVRRMQMGECFANAQALVLRPPAGVGRLVYCEGFAVFEWREPVAVHHAWCVDRTGNVVDPTWHDDARRTYTGVAFRPWVLPHYERVLGPGFNLLADPEVLELTAEEFGKIAYCRGEAAVAIAV